MSSTVKNGASQPIAMPATTVNTATHERSNNFIRKYTNRPNAMMCNRPATVHAAYSVHLHTSNVSESNIMYSNSMMSYIVYDQQVTGY